jgi:alanine-glyoxylate transaminase / serine-glyoxylate transaminase / serine-pyruvate transaminase
MVDDRVIRAIARPAQHHLSESFARVVDHTCERLKRVFGTENEVVLLPATGRGGVEGAIASVHEPGRALLVPCNGSFGRMVAAIGRALGVEVITLEHGPQEPLRRDAIERALDEQDVGILAVVHCETSTGMLNDLEGLGDLAHAHGALFLVDAVSSLGGAPMHVDGIGIDLCVSAAQKAVGALGGTSFVTVSERARAALRERSEQARGSYLDLQRWWTQWLPLDRGGSLASGFRRLPWSMPTHPVFALEEACRILVEEEGLDARVTRHQVAAAAVRETVCALGFRLFPPEGSASPTVTAFETPADLPADELIASLRDRHGIVVAGGLDDLRGRIVRIGHMAETARPAPLLAAIAAIEHEGRRRGVIPPESECVQHRFLQAWHTAYNPLVRS